MNDRLLNLHPEPRVAEMLAKGQWTDQTIDRMFRDQVSTRGDTLALVDPANRTTFAGDEPRRVTWTQLDNEVTALAAELAAVGIRRGDLVAIQLANGIELAEALLALWTLGATASPLPMQYREHEILSLGASAKFDWAIAARRFGERHPAADFSRLSTSLPTLRGVISYGLAGDALEGADNVTNLQPKPATPAQHRAVEEYRAQFPNDPNDCATVCWTSGTEGIPKGVMRAHYDWVIYSTVCTESPNITVDDVVLNAFPMINMAGICAMMLPWIRTGCVLVQHHPFDAPTFFNQIAQERVTYTLAPPALLSMLLQNEGLLSKVDLSTLTRIGSGSAPLSPKMVRGWQERFGLPIINFFGSNEGVALLSNDSDIPDPNDRALYFPRYGVEGYTWSMRLAQWADVKLIDLDTGEEITEPGRPGELHISGPHLFARYLDAENLKNPFDEDGYLKTGDLFEIAGEDGQFFHYVDRAKDIVIRGGMNIAPVELETLILHHPAVADVAVVGRPDETMGEKVAAFVVLHPGMTLDLAELVNYLRQQHIASYKLPESIHELVEMPRNPVGKVLKTQLRQTFAKENA